MCLIWHHITTKSENQTPSGRAGELKIWFRVIWLARPLLRETTTGRKSVKQRAALIIVAPMQPTVECDSGNFTEISENSYLADHTPCRDPSPETVIPGGISSIMWERSLWHM